MPGLKLDRIDIRILACLQQDGRMTNVALAEAVGLSASPCLQRVKRLEAAGYISGYGARLDLARMTDVVTIFTEVTLRDHGREDFKRFETCCNAVREIVECHMVSGGYDYLIRVVARNITHYRDVMETLLEPEIGIQRYASYIVVKSPVERPSPPLDLFLAD